MKKGGCCRGGIDANPGQMEGTTRGGKCSGRGYGIWIDKNIQVGEEEAGTEEEELGLHCIFLPAE